MTSHLEAKLFRADGTLNDGILTHLVRELDATNDSAGLRRLLDTVAKPNSSTFEGAYLVFKPMLRLLDHLDPFGPPRYARLSATVEEWAVALGLMTPAHLNAMLVKSQPLQGAYWLMQMGADPNAALDPESPENLTIIGHVCRVMTQEKRDADTVRFMINAIMSKGEIPYSIKPRYDGDPGALGLFDAVMSAAGGTDARAVLFEAVDALDAQNMLPMNVREALGRACLGRTNMVAYSDDRSSDNANYIVLSYAAFNDPLDWVRAFKNVGDHAQMDVLLIKDGARVRRRLISSLVRDRAPIDEVPAQFTDHHIPCTLLQAASFAGAEDSMRDLIDAGADPLKTVGAGTERFPFEDLDASGLWKCDPYRGVSEVLSAWKARHTIGEVVKQARARSDSPKGEP